MSFRDIPSVDHLLNHPQAASLISAFGHALSVQALREQLALTRQAVLEGATSPDEQTIITQTSDMLTAWLTPTLRSVINATGVIIHTNLGRSPLSRAAWEAMLSVSTGYSTLEYELQRGKRGKRDMHADSLITRLTGAEAALVVNNNAAAVLLALTSLARRKQVLIARSQLIEIGGGFRIPDVLKQSGAKLVEVGTTNRTHLRDFEDAIQDQTALIMRAHHSNFKIVGFTTEPSLAELVELGNRRGIPVLDDIGSGALLDTAQFGLGHEPTVQESLQIGSSLVAFSGDKLLGGPQAGILVGKKVLIDKLRRQPLARAVRPDKLCLAALSATLLHFLKGNATSEVPVWQMISAAEDSLEARATAWRSHLEQGEIIPGRSTVGGGSLPEETLPTTLLALEVKHPNAFAGRLRGVDPPIVARVEDDRVVLDPRTVLTDQENDLLLGIQRVLKR
ncbi:MAG: L-seryl-tRNA(Sec) selenium transferase [Anaerolineales bacterium]